MVITNTLIDGPRAYLVRRAKPVREKPIFLRPILFSLIQLLLEPGHDVLEASDTVHARILAVLQSRQLSYHSHTAKSAFHFISI